jgi:hypothetical protein
MRALRLATSALLCFAALACKRAPEIAEPDPNAKSTASKPASQPKEEPLERAKDQSPCSIKIPQTGDEVAVFPAEEGARAFAEGLVGAGDEFKMAAAMQKHNAFFIPARTACERIGTNKAGTFTKVRITDGPKSGEVGWVDSTWTTGASR